MLSAVAGPPPPWPVALRRFPPIKSFPTVALTRVFEILSVAKLTLSEFEFLLPPMILSAVMF